LFIVILALLNISAMHRIICELLTILKIFWAVTWCTP